MALSQSVLAGTTFEAFVLDAAIFADHAKVTVFAHHPFDREMELTIPASLGGTNPAINWRGMEFEAHQGAGRFTVDADGNVLGWAVEDFDYYHLAKAKAIVADLQTPQQITIDLSTPDYSKPIRATGGTTFDLVRDPAQNTAQDTVRAEVGLELVGAHGYHNIATDTYERNYSSPGFTRTIRIKHSDDSLVAYYRTEEVGFVQLSDFSSVRGAVNELVRKVS